jgi:peptidoglycan/xylan/chitin deacetylase (PgdA/CDA1 family)
MNKLWIKKMVKATVPPVFDALGVYDRAIVAAERNEPIWLVVMYHRIITDPGEDPFQLGMCVTADRFREQIEFYANFFEPIGLSEAVQRRRDGRPMPRKAVSITFDDGYADNLGTALPILREYGIPATVFVTTGERVDGPGLWWDRVIHAIANTNEQKLDLSSLGLASVQGTLTLDRAHRARSLESLLALLWEYDIDTTLEAIGQIERVLHPVSNSKTLPIRLKDEDIAELYAEGVEIGAHTVDHPDLRMTSDDRLKRELLEPKQTLESIIGTTVNGFAYPRGLCNGRVIKAVNDAGYEYAVATQRGLNSDGNNRFLIERMGAPDTSVADLKRCIASITRLGNDGSTTVEAPL